MEKQQLKFKKFDSRISKAFSRHYVKFNNSSKTVQYETQVSEGGEADLHRQAAECQKNPCYAEFIPIKAFNLEHLPKGYRDPQLYEYIKVVTDLTVKVTVDCVSSDRPKFWPDKGDPFPFHGEQVTSRRTGTGEIDVYKFIDGRGFDPRGNEVNVVESMRMGELMTSVATCPCAKCLRSEKPSNVWWEIFVRTAAHVVYDNSEARATSCRLFYDNEDSHTVTLDDFTVDFINVAADRCKLRHFTCDPLGQRLFNLAAHRQKLWAKVWNQFS